MVLWGMAPGKWRPLFVCILSFIQDEEHVSVPWMETCFQLKPAFEKSINMFNCVDIETLVLFCLFALINWVGEMNEWMSLTMTQFPVSILHVDWHFTAAKWLLFVCQSQLLIDMCQWGNCYCCSFADWQRSIRLLLKSATSYIDLKIVLEFSLTFVTQFDWLSLYKNDYLLKSTLCCKWWDYYLQFTTRMHSSRMRTVLCSGRWRGGRWVSP